MTTEEETILLTAATMTLVIGLFGSIFPIPSSIAIGAGIVLAWIQLKEEQISGQYVTVTSLIYILTGLMLHIGMLNLDDIYYSWSGLVILLGVFGLIYERIVSSVFGGVTILTAAFELRILVSPQTYLTIGIIPAALISVFFKIVYIPVISDIILLVTGIALFGFLYSGAFILDSKLAQSVGRQYNRVR